MPINKKRTTSRKVEKIQESSHKNWMGGNSWDISNPIYSLRLAASSCFFGEPMYYHSDKGGKVKTRVYRPKNLSTSQLDYLRETLNAIDPKEWRDMSPSQLMEDAIDKALDYDIEATLKEAVRLRKEENIRTTPQVILVRASNHPKVKGTNLIRKYAQDIILRGDEPSVCTAYHIATYSNGKVKMPTRLKKALADRLESFNEYKLAKYKMESRSVKTVDVVNLVHPKSTPAIDKLVNGTLTTTGETWESIISKEGSNQKSWTKALDKMGHMALLRNLRNLYQNDVPYSAFLDKLKEGVKFGKQLPFRYFSAYKELENINAPAPILDTIEDCLMISLDNVPSFKGKVMSLVDNSGSTHGTPISSMSKMTVNQIGNLTGIITAMVSDEGYVGVFGDNLKQVPIRKKSSVFDQLNKVNKIGNVIGGGTEHGIWLFWDKAIREKEHWDSVFIYSDMQAGHGGLYGTGGYNNYIWNSRHGRYIDVPKLIADYRRNVNPNVKVFCVQIAGYQDTIVPEFYDNTYILGGWGNGILKFADYLSNHLQQ